MISLYLVAIALGQLLWGSAADRFGRRPAMIGSLVLFCIGSAMAAAAHSIEWLLLGRAIQGLGSSGTLVTSRAVVADVSGPDKAVQSLAALATITLISPAIAPGIGGLVVEVGGWRMIFGVLLCLGTALLLAVASRFRETGGGSKRVPPRALVQRHSRFLGSPRFVGVALGSSLWTALMYHFLAASPFVLHQTYGLSPAQSGLVYLAISGCMIAGTLLVRLLKSHDAGQLLKIAGRFMAAGIILLIIAATGALPGLPGLIVPMAPCAMACGICVPAALALAQRNAGDAVATASSLFGAMQMLIAAAVASSVSHIFDHGPALLLSLATLGTLGGTFFHFATRGPR